MGRKDLPQVRKYIFYEAKVLLKGCDPSSLVIDTLGDRTKGLNAAVACFYFDFAESPQAGRLSTRTLRAMYYATAKSNSATAQPG